MPEVDLSDLGTLVGAQSGPSGQIDLSDLGAGPVSGGTTEDPSELSEAAGAALEHPEDPGRITKMPRTVGEAVRFTAGGVLHPIRQTETAIEQTAIQLGLADPGSRLKIRPSEMMEQPIFGRIPQIKQQKGKLAQIGAGAVNTVSEFVNFFMTPEGLASMGLGMLPRMLSKAILADYAVDMAMHTPEQLQGAVQAAKEGNLQVATQNALGAAGATAMVPFIAKHAGAPDRLSPEVTLPQSIKRLEGIDALQKQEAGEVLRDVSEQSGNVYEGLPPAEGAERVPRRRKSGEPSTGSEAEAPLSDLSLEGLRRVAAETDEAIRARSGSWVARNEAMLRRQAARDLLAREEAELPVATPPVEMETVTVFKSQPNVALEVVERSADGKKALVRRREGGPTYSVPAKELVERQRPKAEQPRPAEADIAERAAIDDATAANEAAGLPAQVTYEPPTDPNVPFARRIATGDAQGIQLNLDELRMWLRSVPAKRRQAAMRSLFAEEGIHSLASHIVTPEEFAALWNGLTAAERGLVNKSYTGRWKGLPDRFSAEQMGNEYFRRVLQRAMGMETREFAEAPGFRLTERTIDIIERLIVRLRRMVGKNARLDTLRERLEAAIADAKGVEKTAAEGKAPSAYRKEQSEKVGTRADEYGALHGPEFTPQLRERLASMDEVMELPSSDPGVSYSLKIGGNKFWLEASKEGEGAFQDTAIAYLHVASDGSTTFNGSFTNPAHRNNPLATLAKDKLLSYINRPGWTQKAIEGGPAAYRKEGPPLSEGQRRFLRTLVNPVESEFGKEAPRYQESLAELTDKPVYHETDLNSAKAIYQQSSKRPYGFTRFFVSDDLDLALGQSGKGVTLEMAPSRLNGVEREKPGTGIVGEGKEYSVDRFVGRYVRAVIFSNARQMESFRKTSPNSLDYDRAAPANRGIANKDGIRVPVKTVQSEAPAGYRKRGPGEGQERLFLPPMGSGESRPTGAEMGVLPEKALTPTVVDAAIVSALQSKRPSFSEALATLKEQFPNIQPGQLREAWQDATWKYLTQASGQELKRLRDALGLKETVAENIPDARPESERGFALQGEFEADVRKEGRAVESAAAERGRQIERIRANAIARIGEKLIAQAEKGRPYLRRPTVTPDEIGWWRRTEGAEPAYREISAADRRNPQKLGRVLTSDASMERSGRGSLPETATKRVTALIDTQTGAVDMVSTFRTGRDVVYIFNPELASLGRNRPNVTLDKLLAKKNSQGQPRFKPIASILLDEPVQNFHQRYSSLRAYREKFGDAAASEEARRAEHYELPEEGVAEAPSALRADVPLTDTEAGALLDHIYDETGKLQSREDVAAAYDAIKLKAADGTLTGRDWQVIKALQKENFKTEQADPNLRGTNEAIEKTIDRIWDQAQQASDRADFIKRLGVVEETVGARAQEAGGRELTLPEGQPEAAKATRDYHTRIARYGKFPGQGSPEAFRKPQRFWPLDAARFYSEWMLDRLRRVGGQAAAGAVDTFNGIISRGKELYGSLTPSLDPARRAAGRLNKATTWANDLRRIDAKTFVTNAVLALEKRIPIPDFARDLIDLGDTANTDIGRMLQAVIPGFLATGKWQRNPTPFGMDVIRQGSGKIWEDWTQGLATANRVPVTQIRDFFLRWKRLMDEPGGPNAARLERINQDFSRKYPNVVTHVMVDGPLGGHIEAVVHGKLFNYLEASARRAAAIRAFREAFPPDPKTGKSAAFERLYRRILDGDPAAGQPGMPSQYKPLLDDLIRALNGHPVDPYSSILGGVLAPSQPLGRAWQLVNQTIGNVMAKSVLTMQVPTQSGELVAGATPVFLGAPRYLRALERIKQLYPQMERDGAVNPVMFDYSMDKTAKIRSGARQLGNAIDQVFAEQWGNELQEKWAATTARLVTEDIQSGNLSAWDRSMLPQTFTAMGFTRAQARAMMSNLAPDLLKQFERKAASWLTAGNKAMAEGSALGASILFNSMFRFQAYPMMKLNQFRGVARNFRTAENTAQRVAAARLLTRFLVGGTLQGAITTAVVSMFSDWIFGTSILKNEAEDDPIKFAAEAWVATMGGPLYIVWRGMANQMFSAAGQMKQGNMGGVVRGVRQGVSGVGEAAKRAFFPTQMISSLWDMTGDEGAYKDLDTGQRIGKFIEQKVPGMRAVRTALAITGIASQPSKKFEVSRRAFYRWKSQTMGWKREESYLVEDPNKEFRMAMKQATIALTKGDEDAFNDAMEKATGEKTPRAIKASLKRRKILVDLDGKPLDDDKMTALQNHIGVEAVDRLRYYDLMLDAAAEGIMLPPEP